MTVTELMLKIQSQHFVTLDIVIIWNSWLRLQDGDSKQKQGQPCFMDYLNVLSIE